MSQTATGENGARETLGFQAEVKQLLKLMIHSLYSNKEIFLRELISNASDAADKLRFEALADAALFESDPELRIRVSVDKDARTITIADNGIGMSREEVIANIGTIARSGTREFLDRLTGDQKKDANLIGQFGVGFYSSFIVADKVTLTTRRAGLAPEAAVRWESDGGGEYVLEPVTRPERGTEIVMHLREGEDDLLEAWKVKGIIRKYSDHISLPILLAGEDAPVNQASALWARNKADVTEEQYREFYTHVAHDPEPPLAWTHGKVEGRQEYTQLLYVPAQAPFDLWDRHSRRGVKLYVRRVFIMEDAEHLMPGYLRFVRGVIDSNDLPLNVSREILQESKDVESIRAGATRRVLSLLDDLAENQKEKYATFWKAFGLVLKEGVGEDHANRDRVAKLLRFATTRGDTDVQDVSLADYVARMQPGQDKIYFVTAESFNAARSSPHLEVFRKKGIEVLLMHDRVDEWLVGNLAEFDGKPLASVARGGLDLGDEAEKKEAEEKGKEFGELTGRIKEALGARVKDVRVTMRLTESPACLVADEHDIGGNLARILRAAGQKAPESPPILEINPSHPIVLRLKHEEKHFGDWAALLFEQALLAEGGELEDPAGFVKRLNGLLLELSA
jgi:molecular chaperone HtpG